MKSILLPRLGLQGCSILKLYAWNDFKLKFNAMLYTTFSNLGHISDFKVTKYCGIIRFCRGFIFTNFKPQ